jgi:hypothetical protein
LAADHADGVVLRQSELALDGIIALEVAAEGDYLYITVDDTGESIAADDLPPIWECYYRGKNQTTKGSGLGLALVKELPEAMDGRAAVSPFRSPPFLNLSATQLPHSRQRTATNLHYTLDNSFSARWWAVRSRGIRRFQAAYTPEGRQSCIFVKIYSGRCSPS